MTGGCCFFSVGVLDIHGGYSSIDALLRTRKLAEEQLKQFWRPSVFLEMFFVAQRNSIVEADAWYFQDL